MRKMNKVEAFLFRDQYLLNRMGYNMSFAEIGFVLLLATLLGVGLGAFVGKLLGG